MDGAQLERGEERQGTVAVNKCVYVQVVREGHVEGVDGCGIIGILSSLPCCKFGGVAIAGEMPTSILLLNCKHSLGAHDVCKLPVCIRSAVKWTSEGHRFEDPCC